MMTPITVDRNSNIIRMRIMDATSTTGAGKTGILAGSAALVVSVMSDNSATATVYSAANTETITTLGTYPAGGPTAGKCGFRAVDNTNFPGLYELHFADAVFSVAGATKLYICLTGPFVQTMGVIPLWVLDTGTPMRGTDNAATSTQATDILAAVGALTDIRGPGATSKTILISNGTIGLVGAGVWLTSDEPGTNVVAGTLYTDDNGLVSFDVDVGATYYVWTDSALANFTNPLEWTVT